MAMDQFQTLPSEEEMGQWMEREAFKDDVEAFDQVLEGFKAMTTFTRTKKIMITMSNDAQLQTFLAVMGKDGEQGRLWPGLGQEVRVRVETRMGRSMDIVVLDVDPESDVDLVRQAMEKYGQVRRCERMKMSGKFHRVVVNKVKVELVRNETRLPNIIHAFGTTTSPDDFATWKMEYRGCQRYCYGCGATSHEARQCEEQRTNRGRLERMASVVGEEQEETGEPQPLSYAAVLKDPTYLARQNKEREEEKRRREERREDRSAREERERRERRSRETEEQKMAEAGRDRRESQAAARVALAGVVETAALAGVVEAAALAGVVETAAPPAVVEQTVEPPAAAAAEAMEEVAAPLAAVEEKAVAEEASLAWPGLEEATLASQASQAVEAMEEAAAPPAVEAMEETAAPLAAVEEKAEPRAAEVEEAAAPPAAEVVGTAAPQEKGEVGTTEGMATRVETDVAPQVGAAGAGEGVKEREDRKHMKEPEEESRSRRRSKGESSLGRSDSKKGSSSRSGSRKPHPKPAYASSSRERDEKKKRREREEKMRRERRGDYTREKDAEGRGEASSAHKRSASKSGFQGDGAKRVQRQDPETKPNTPTETLRETGGGTPDLAPEEGKAERREREDGGEVAEEEAGVDDWFDWFDEEGNAREGGSQSSSADQVEAASKETSKEVPKEDENQNGNPARQGLNRHNGC